MHNYALALIIKREKKYRQEAFNWMYFKQQEWIFCESFCKSDRPNSMAFYKNNL